ncbi:hypothetical protein FC678_15270 [Peribacillus simplex]|uniref:Uncharacterized protein n=1 Tax=Peribacillus simplex TaxID=1478 RepID=A0A9X8ZFZ0_9BACI|nr:hypothetical protein [Peribacillus simplex]TKH10179.1 hypothetical protein FC678_15270 [Peribacillus simplex]
MLFALVTTTVWYRIGNPLKIDNIYVVAVTPSIVMRIDHIIGKNECVLQNEANKECKVIKLVAIWTWGYNNIYDDIERGGYSLFFFIHPKICDRIE